jgi:predicted GTPase
MQTKRENKLNQQKYRDSMKSKGLKMVVIPLLERDIQTAVEITRSPTERDAIIAMFQRGLEKQRDLLDQPVINNKLITAINHEREKLQQEIATYA